MAERPTPERLAEIRADHEGLTTDDCCVPELLAELDTAIARAVAAEQRAGTVELAVAALHQAAVSFEAPLSEWCDGPLRDALWTALAATPTALAEALRRELLADGMDKAATELVEYYRVRAHRSGRVDEAQLLADLSDDITTTAAELRGPK